MWFLGYEQASLWFLSIVNSVTGREWKNGKNVFKKLPVKIGNHRCQPLWECQSGVSLNLEQVWPYWSPGQESGLLQLQKVLPDHIGTTVIICCDFLTGLTNLIIYLTGEVACLMGSVFPEMELSGAD